MYGFNMMIERLKRETGLSYIETLIMFCEDNSTDFEDIAKIIHPSLKEKIQTEASKLNMMKDNDLGTSLEQFFGD